MKIHPDLFFFFLEEQFRSPTHNVQNQEGLAHHTRITHIPEVMVADRGGMQ